MKALPKKLLPLILFGIAVTSLYSVQPAQAGYIVTLDQVGSNVVATGSGAIDLTGLTFEEGSMGFPAIIPNGAFIQTGPTPFASVDVYAGLIIGPTNFGSGGLTFASSGSGDTVGYLAVAFLVERLTVPRGYVSGHALSDSSTYDSATFASLGVTPGTYEWTWGAGANQNFTLQIGAAGVPDGGSTVSLLGCALLGLAALRRKLSC